MVNFKDCTNPDKLIKPAGLIKAIWKTYNLVYKSRTEICRPINRTKFGNENQHRYQDSLSVPTAKNRWYQPTASL